MALQGKIEVVVPSKFADGGFRVKLSGLTGRPDGKTEDWYGAKTRREGELEAGFVIKFNTVSEGKNIFINQVKLVSKEQPTPRAGGKSGSVGGGGGYRKDPAQAAAQEARYVAQATREAEKHAHQLAVIEPRIVWSDARSKALELVSLYIANGALALGAENAAKRKGIIDAAIAAATQEFYAVSIAIGHAATVAPAVAQAEDPLDGLESDPEFADDADEFGDEEEVL